MMTPGSLHSVTLGTTRQVLSRVSKRMDLKLRAMYARAQLRRADMEKHHGSELQHRSASIMQWSAPANGSPCCARRRTTSTE